MVGPASPRCEHTHSVSFVKASPTQSAAFCKLKVLELMLLLGRIPQERCCGSVCSAEQTALAHHLRDHLLTNREGYVSLPSWRQSARFPCVAHAKAVQTMDLWYANVHHYIRNTVWSKQRWAEFAAGSLSLRLRNVPDMTTPANFQRALKSGTGRRRPAIVPIKNMQKRASKTKRSSLKTQSMLEYPVVRDTNQRTSGGTV